MRAKHVVCQRRPNEDEHEPCGGVYRAARRSAWAMNHEFPLVMKAVFVRDRVPTGLPEDLFDCERMTPFAQAERAASIVCQHNRETTLHPSTKTGYVLSRRFAKSPSSVDMRILHVGVVSNACERRKSRMMRALVDKRGAHVTDGRRGNDEEERKGSENHACFHYRCACGGPYGRCRMLAASCVGG